MVGADRDNWRRTMWRGAKDVMPGRQRGYHRAQRGVKLCGMENDAEYDVSARLAELRLEHRDLDDAIHRMAQDPAADQLRLRRMKKRKLLLKDTIAKIESSMIPDLDA